MSAGRDIMKGRHAVGGRTANPGKWRKGQSEPASNKITTNAQAQTSKKAPLVPDAKATSANAQTMIAEAPSPFKNKMQTGEMPTPSGASGGVSTLEPRIQSGLKHSNPGARSNPGGAATGYSKLPNQSSQIGGRMGWPPPKRKTGDNSPGYKVKKGAAFYGE